MLWESKASYYFDKQLGFEITLREHHHHLIVSIFYANYCEGRILKTLGMKMASPTQQRW